MEIILITWAALIPLLCILLMLTIKKYKKVRGMYQLDDIDAITPNNYTDLNLIEVGTDYRVPRGQVPFFIYDVNNMDIGQKERKYVGSTKGGINLPFMHLSLQNKTFIEGTTYQSWGPSRITITNRLVRLVSAEDSPIKREVKIVDIEQMKYVQDNKTVQISSRGWAWPVRLSFSTKIEAIEFQNAIWTILYTYSSLRRETKIHTGDTYE